MVVKTVRVESGLTLEKRGSYYKANVVLEAEVEPTEDIDKVMSDLFDKANEQVDKQIEEAIQ